MDLLLTLLLLPCRSQYLPVPGFFWVFFFFEKIQIEYFILSIYSPIRLFMPLEKLSMSIFAPFTQKQVQMEPGHLMF